MPDTAEPVCDALVHWDLHSEPPPTPQRPLPLLLALKDGWRQQGSLLDQIAPAAYVGSERFATVRVRSAEEFEDLRRGESSRWVERIALGRARTMASTSLSVVSGGGTRPKLRGTVVAVIDDHCAFAHERFRWLDAAGTWRPRVMALWDQAQDDHATGSSVWAPARDFGYGRELDGEGIQRLFADPACLSGGAIDEDKLYRQVGHRGMDRLETHGTHVLDLAAGADPLDESSEHEPQIVFVQLPDEAVRDTSGHWLAVSVVDALRYVHERVAADAKLVVNLSYGALAGPHDGTQAIEQAIEHLHTLRPHDFALVLPAGNGFDAGCHASAVAAPGGSVEFVVDVRADDPTHSFVELWSATAADADFWALSPNGEKLDASSPRLEDGAGRLLAELLKPRRGGDSRAQALLCMKPVVMSDGVVNAALPGRWRLFASNSAAAQQAVRIDAWIERDEVVRGPSHPRAWQATFVGVSGAEAQLEDRRATLNSIANGLSPIVVGACRDAADPVMCDYSGSGSSLAKRAGPDVVALGDESAWQAGISAAGTRSAYTFRMRGTSVAAPQVARWIAGWLNLQRQPQPLDRIKAALREHAGRRPATDPAGAPASSRVGAGFVG
jgi:Subtilase family